ncbi:hypothetical protein D9M72_426690 [compost metagenome]
MNQQRVVPRCSELQKLNRALGVVKQQDGIRSAELQSPGGPGQVHSFDVAQYTGVAAPGRHHIQGRVACDEVLAGLAKFLGGVEQPLSVPGLTCRAHRLAAAVGSPDRFRFSSNDGNAVHAGLEVMVAALMKGCNEVHRASVRAEGFSAVVSRGERELTGRREQGVRGVGVRSRTGFFCSTFRSGLLRPQGAPCGRNGRLVVQLGHLHNVELQRLVRRVSHAVHPVFEVRDEPRVLGPGGYAVQSAVPAVVGRPGAKDNAARIGRPSERGDAEFGACQDLRFAAGSLHDIKLRLPVCSSAQERQHQSVRGKCRCRVTEAAGQPAGQLFRVQRHSP